MKKLLLTIILNKEKQHLQNRVPIIEKLLCFIVQLKCPVSYDASL